MRGNLTFPVHAGMVAALRWWAEKKIQRQTFWALALLLLLGVLYLVRGMLLAFALAIVLVYLLNPLVCLVEKQGLSRLKAVLLVFLFAALAAFALAFYGFPRMLAQLDELVGAIPAYSAQVREISSDLAGRYADSGLPPGLKSIIDERISWVEERLLELARQGAMALTWLVGQFLNIFLAPVLAFYILKDMKIFKEFFTRHLPPLLRPDLLLLLSDINTVMSRYIQGYLLVCALVGVLIGLAIHLMGIKFALTLGILSGITELIPYFGPIIGALPVVALALLTSKWLALKVVIVFLLIHQFEANVISPKIMGDRVGLHPLAVIIFLLAGAELMGLAGLLLAVPAAAVAKIFLLFFWRRLSNTH